MTNKIYAFALSALFLTLLGCQDDDTPFGAVIAPQNLTAQITVADDLSGNVTVTPSADFAVTFHVFFRQDRDPVVISNGQSASFRYTDTGQYTQEVIIIAYGRGGAASSISTSIELNVILVIDPVILDNLAGAQGLGKRWVWDAASTGHFGVGDPAESFPNYFSAAPNQLNPCLYDDVLTFSYDGMGNYDFLLETNEASFINWAEVKRFFPNDTPQEYNDECRDLSPFLDFDTTFVVLDDPVTGASVLTVANSVMSYWSGATAYDIIELTADKLVIRGIQQPFDPQGGALAWYHAFVPEGEPEPSCSAFTGDTGSGMLDTLVWAE